MNRKQDIELILRREAQLARKKTRAITLTPQNPSGEPELPGDPSIEASGAVHLEIQDIIPTLDAYGMGLPKGVQMAQGVTGNEVWPISEDDVEVFEIGEVETLAEQDLSFSKFSPTPQRVSLALSVTNQAIDNAAFDIVGFIRGKVQLAIQKYLARHFYSFEPWDGNRGPFVDAVTVPFEGSLPDAIQAAMTRFHNAGFDLKTAAVVMNIETEMLLKQTPINEAVPQMIIENGLCAGYPYIVNKYFGTTKDSDGQLETTFPFCLGVGVFNWTAVHQHAGGRIIIDAHSADVAKRDLTTIVVNTWWSMSNLAAHMKTADGSEPAFQIVAKNNYVLADRYSTLFVTSDGFLLAV
jgi:hypothetical protein